MKRRLGLAAAVVLGLSVVGLAGAWGYLAYTTRSARLQREAALAARFTEHKAAFVEDHRALTSHPLAAIWSPATGQGHDAAELLHPRLDWSGLEPADRRAPTEPGLAVSPELKAATEKEAWWREPAAVPLPTAELAFLDSLRAYDRWDPGAKGSPLAAYRGEPIAAPLPSFLPLLTLMRARHAQGLVTGDTASAIGTGRAVARLLFSSSTLIGAMVGVSILSMEPPAAAAAIARGQQLGEIAPLDEATTARLKRAVLAADVVLQLGAPEEAHALLPEVRAGRCGAIAEAAALGLMLRPWVADSQVRQLARLRAALDEPGCSFEWLRAAWDRPVDTSLRAATVCWASSEIGVSGNDGCELAAAAEWMPGMRGILGDLLLGIAARDPMQGYAKAP